MQPEFINSNLDMCTRYPLRLGGPKQCGIGSLFYTSTHDKCWKSNPRPSDLESSALSTLSYDPMVLSTYPANPYTSLNQFGSVFVRVWLKSLKADGLVYHCTCL